MRRIGAIVIIILTSAAGLATAACGATAACDSGVGQAVDESHVRPLPAALLRWLASDTLRHAAVGLDVAVVGEDGTAEVVYTYQPHLALVPASTLKLVTTATALALCGSEATVTTEVWATGRVDTTSGTIDGDLVLRGHGDATLGAAYADGGAGAFADSVVTVLKRLGVRRIAGRVVGDGHLLDGPAVAPGWTWEDLGNHYAAGLYGLNYGGNVYRLTLDTSRRGVRPRVAGITPDVPGLVIDNRLSGTPCAFDSAYLYGIPYDGRRTIDGAVPQGDATFSIRGDIPDPPLFAAAEVAAALRRAGIVVAGGTASDATLRRDGSPLPAGRRRLYVHHSPPLRDIVRHTNVESQNLLAEMTLRQVAATRGETSAAAGIAAVTDYWRQRAADAPSLTMADGCGLSPYDRLSARLLTEVLLTARRDSAFRASLPVAGQTGTVRRFLAHTRLAGRAWLKTGTTRQALAYSGYVEGRDGRLYLFTIIINGFAGKASALRPRVQDLMLLLIP